MKLSGESLLSIPSNGECCSGNDPKIERPFKEPVKIAEQFQKITFRRPPSTLSKEETDKKSKEQAAGRTMFSRQYAHVYGSRLSAMRPILEEKVKQEWQQDKDSAVVKMISELCQSSSGQNHGVHGQKVADAAGRSPSKKGGRSSLNTSTDSHEQHIAMREDIVVVIIGTIFKQQPEKPSILQELVEDNPMVPTKIKSNYISAKDSIVLEDESSRVTLVPLEGCGMTVDSLVNGVICAVKGKPTIQGKFDVQEVIWATPKPSVWPKKRESDIEMIFVSGLLLGSHRKHMSHLDLLFDYLQGLVGSPEEHETQLRIKARLFILGDTFGVEEAKAKKNVNDRMTEEEKLSRTEVAKKLDNILHELSQTMEVYLVPGQLDPAEPMFPQAPIHRCILPQASRLSSFHSMCNPTRLQIPVEEKSKSSLDVLLSGGQSVVDAMKNTNIRNPLEMAETLLKWGHICPTAPDTLPLHPGVDDDIFVVKTLPNLFILGGQKRFGVREYKGTNIVTVPRFSETGIAVVYNKKMNFVPLNIKLID